MNLINDSANNANSTTDDNDYHGGHGSERSNGNGGNGNGGNGNGGNGNGGNGNGNNYSKNNRPKNQSGLFAIVKRLLVKLTLLVSAIGVIVALMIAIVIITTYPKLPNMDELKSYQPKLPLQVYSQDGVLLGQFGQERRIYLKVNDAPKMLIDAILAAEDERFFQHGGIDFIGVIRATISNAVSGHIQSGASTITMQVARNFFLTSKRSYWRKLEEAMLSYKIEKSLSKEQVLELYLNQIYLGQRAYGFAEAALTYFGKPLDKLTIAEYAILASLPKAPSAFNPVVNQKRSRSRELYVLERMFKLGFINKLQYQEAITQRVIVIKGTNKDNIDSGNYVAEMARQMLYAKLGESIYTAGYKIYTTINSKMQQQAYIALRNGLLNYDKTHGYKGAEQQISLTQDAPNDAITEQLIANAFSNIVDYGNLQAAIVLVANNNYIKARIRNGDDVELTGASLDFVRKYIASNNQSRANNHMLNNNGNKNTSTSTAFGNSGNNHDSHGGGFAIQYGAVIRLVNDNGNWRISQLPEVQGAILALDPNSGAIKTLIGGFDFNANRFNHATQAMRQPGSSFKPFIYSAALNKGFNANSIVSDSPVCFPNGSSGDWCPKNDERDFQGDVSLRYALTKSLNVPTAKIINQITPQYAIDYISRFGFDQSQFQPYLTLALGADEVTVLQMAKAYAVFANGGHLVEPYLIDYITDNNGKLIAKTQPISLTNAPLVIDNRNAFIMNSILKDVVRYGTGARVYRELKRDDLAGKTGTTNDNKDVWFDGYTPNLVTITWMGFDTPKSLGEHAYGASLALPIWLDFMKAVLPDIPINNNTVVPNGIIIQHNATWRGNDEYILDPTFTPAALQHESAYIGDINNNISHNNTSGSITSGSIDNDSANNDGANNSNNANNDQDKGNDDSDE